MAPHIRSLSLSRLRILHHLRSSALHRIATMDEGATPVATALGRLLQQPGVVRGYFAPPPFAPFARIGGRQPAAGGAPTAAAPRAPPPRAMARNFAAGCLAACSAVTITNPFDVVRTRLELQGELALRGAQQAQTRVYRGAVHALVTILTQEGPAALGKGLAPAYAYQIAANGSRLGAYGPLKQWLLQQQALGLGPFAASVLAGAAAGVLGAALGTPFQLVKTRMQASAMAGRSYRGLLHALGAVARAEGVVGLWRGVHVAVIKMGIASAVQLSVFDGVRSELIRRQEWFRERPAAAAAAASLAAGLAVTAVINPLDVVTTRLWNQPVVGGRGTLYASAADCLIKTVAAEGPLSLYKGCTAHFLRVGPHTIATLLLLERVQRLMGVPQPAPAP